MDNNITVPSVVRYNDEFYVCHKIVEGRAHLITKNADKYSGTPTVDKLVQIRPIPTKEFNHHFYFKTKVGVFGISTGKPIKMPEILAMFKEE